MAETVGRNLLPPCWDVAALVGGAAAKSNLAGRRAWSDQVTKLLAIGPGSVGICIHLISVPFATGALTCLEPFSISDPPPLARGRRGNPSTLLLAGGTKNCVG